MKKKWWYLLIAALFLLFALVQLNDPDPFWWTLIYLMAFISYVAFYAGNRAARPIAAIGLVAALIWAATLVPQFFQWIKMGAPTIVGSMKATEPHIEFVREFLGLVSLVIAFAWLRPWTLFKANQSF